MKLSQAGLRRWALQQYSTRVPKDAVRPAASSATSSTDLWASRAHLIANQLPHVCASAGSRISLPPPHPHPHPHPTQKTPREPRVPRLHFLPGWGVTASLRCSKLMAPPGEGSCNSDALCGSVASAPPHLLQHQAVAGAVARARVPRHAVAARQQMHATGVVHPQRDLLKALQLLRRLEHPSVLLL